MFLNIYTKFDMKDFYYLMIKKDMNTILEKAIII